MSFCRSYRIKLFTVLCLLMLFCSCTRNPFGRYPDEVQDASAYTKDVYYLGHNFGQQIVFENIANIEASDIWQTFVGDSFNMVVTGHVLLKDEEFDDFYVELVSPPLDNERYEFNEVDTGDESKEKQYVFQWEPSSSFLGDDFRKVINLRFRLTIVTKTSINITIFDNFPVFIYEQPILTEPTIVSIENPAMVSSESVCKIKVKVFDRNSNEDYPPVIDFVDVDRRYDVSDLITFSNKSQIDDYTWEFEYDFRPQPLGEEKQIPYQFEVRALSKFGVSSSPKRSQLTIFRDMENLPEVMGAENITTYAGSNFVMELQVQDPFNGDLSLDRLLHSGDIPGSFEAYKRKGNNGFSVSIIWNIPENTEEVDDVLGEYEFYIEMEYQWSHNGDTFTKKVSHRVKVNIISAESFESDMQDIVIEEKAP